MEILISQKYSYEKIHTFFFPADHSSRQEKGEMLRLIFNYEFSLLWLPNFFFVLLVFFVLLFLIKFMPKLVSYGDRVTLEYKISTYWVNAGMVATAGFLKT